jgi:predicted XRE-type DNA-binding protein
MKNIPFEKSGGNVFADLGFSPAATAELTVKSTLISTIGDTIRERELTQQEAASSAATISPRCPKSCSAAWKASRLTSWWRG